MKRFWTIFAVLILGLVFAAWAQNYRLIPALKVGGGYGDTGTTLEPDGDINTDGDVTANAFVGDGSGLTGVGAGDFEDSTFRIQDDGDATKEIAFEASGITTGTTRTVTMPDSAVDLGDIATNNAKVTNATHTGDVTGATTLTIAAGAIDIAMHSATGTADATTFYRGDNHWATPAGAGDMTLAGTQTVTGAKTFEDATLILEGSTSGTTTLKADATAGTTVATFQAATGTVAYSADIPADTDSLAEGSTNRYVTTADEAKLGHITVTQAVNLDQMETDIAGLGGGGIFPDDTFTIEDDADDTKHLVFQLSGISSGATRQATWPDANIDFGSLGTSNLADEAVTNAKLAHMSARTLKGRAVGAGTGDATDLTLLQAMTLLDTPTGLTSSSNAVAWNSDNAWQFTHTLTENTTIAATSGTPFDGQRAKFTITQAAGTYTLAWNAEFIAGSDFSDTIPSVSSTNGDVDVYGFVYFAGTINKWVLHAHMTH